MNVITYMNANGTYCNLTPKQALTLEEAGLWIRNEGGYLSSVSYGQHRGDADFTDAQLASLIGGDVVNGLVAS